MVWNRRTPQDSRGHFRGPRGPRTHKQPAGPTRHVGTSVWSTEQTGAAEPPRPGHTARVPGGDGRSGSSWRGPEGELLRDSATRQGQTQILQDAQETERFLATVRFQEQILHREIKVLFSRVSVPVQSPKGKHSHQSKKGFLNQKVQSCFLSSPVIYKNSWYWFPETGRQQLPEFGV